MPKVNWQGDEYKGWGEPEEELPPSEVTVEDSSRIALLLKQVKKGRYSAMTLRIYIGKAKGLRPLKLRIRDVPNEIRRAGNRWGVTYDIATDEYLVWGGGEPRKGYSPTYTGEIDPEWERIAADVIRNMPPVLLKKSSFLNYFNKVARRIGYKNIITKYLVDAILQGRLKVAVVITADGKVDVVGGKARSIMSRVK